MPPVQSDTDAAQAAAEHAVVPILSYDAHSLDRSQAQATAVMTSSEQEQYRRLFAVIRQNAPRTATVVRAQYVSSGVVRSGTDQVGGDCRGRLRHLDGRPAFQRDHFAAGNVLGGAFLRRTDEHGEQQQREQRVKD